MTTCTSNSTSDNQFNNARTGVKLTQKLSEELLKRKYKRAVAFNTLMGQFHKHDPNSQPNLLLDESDLDQEVIDTGDPDMSDESS